MNSCWTAESFIPTRCRRFRHNCSHELGSPCIGFRMAVSRVAFLKYRPLYGQLQRFPASVFQSRDTMLVFFWLTINYQLFVRRISTFLIQRPMGRSSRISSEVVFQPSNPGSLHRKNKRSHSSFERHHKSQRDVE